MPWPSKPTTSCAVIISSHSHHDFFTNEGANRIRQNVSVFEDTNNNNNDRTNAKHNNKINNNKTKTRTQITKKIKMTITKTKTIPKTMKIKLKN